MKVTTNFLDVQNDQRPVRGFGVALALIHFATAWFWSGYRMRSDAVCWAFFDQCENWQRGVAAHYDHIITLYGALAVISAFLFLWSDLRTARIFFLLVTVAKFVLQLSDYRLMGNYHYMTNIVSFGFVLLPRPSQMSRLWLVLFYFSAGLIKFNADWLSGHALLATPIISGKWLEFALAWAILLEMVGVFFLLGKRNGIFWFVFAQLAFFHLFSWHIVGYFYPTVMFLMLTSFLFFREPVVFPRSNWNRLAIALFLVAQAIPALLFPEPSLTGQGRVLSLNMLDAWSICETRFFIRTQNKMVEYAPTIRPPGVRIHCDPAFLLAKLKETCADQSKQADFIDIDVDHQVRRSIDATKIEQFTFRNACSNPLRLTWLSELVQTTAGDAK